jgi:hypothetical protein
MLVSEIRLYNEEQVEEGAETGTYMSASELR